MILKNQLVEFGTFEMMSFDRACESLMSSSRAFLVAAVLAILKIIHN